MRQRGLHTLAYEGLTRQKKFSACRVTFELNEVTVRSPLKDTWCALFGDKRRSLDSEEGEVFLASGPQ